MSLNAEYWSDSEIVCDAIRELRRQAVNGVAPSTSEYTRQRRPDAPGVTVIAKRLKWPWSELARAAGLEYYGGRQHERGNPMDQPLPEWLQEDIAQEHTCECGQEATHIGRFISISANRNRVGNAMLLCEECAAWVRKHDAGVRVEPLAQPALGLVAEGVSA